MKFSRLSHLKTKVKPNTFFDRLADDGLLEDYIERFYKNKMDTDEDFRSEIFDILYRYAQQPVTDVEAFYLEKLIETLSYFLEYTNQWTKQKP